MCDFPVVVVNDTFLCNSAPIQIDAGIYPAGTSFSWSNGATEQEAQFTAPGDYTLTVTLAEGCERSEEFNVRDELISIETSPDTIILPRGTAQLLATGGETYSWTPTNGLSCTTCPDPMASPSSTTVYTVVAASPSGCTVEGMIQVEVNPNPSSSILEIPKFFSPNGDGINDEWKIPNIGLFPNSGLSVIDRWGTRVFEANNYENNWRGTYQRGQKNLPPGTYFYVLELSNGDFIKGTVTILRKD